MSYIGNVSEYNSVGTLQIEDGAVTASKIDPTAIYTQTTTDAKVLDAKAGRKNLIINGDMQVSQRGDYTSATSATHTQYYIDRWVANSTSANTITHVLTNQPNSESGKSIKNIATASATSIFGHVQHLEEYAKLSNRTLTLSAWVKSNSSNARLGFKLDSTWGNIPDSHSGGGTWEKLTYTFSTGVVSSAALILIGLHTATVAAVAVTSGD
jgi:hypothetical protein